MVTRENTTKDEQAHTVATSHYIQEPVIVEILRILSPDEESDREPVKLLEVNPDTVPAGIVPVRFWPHPHSGAPYSTVIVEVTPEEYEEIKIGNLPLRDGWTLGAPITRPNGTAHGVGAHIDGDRWSQAFARQARADYHTYLLLDEDDSLPVSQRLHMLLMACEKLCKAYMFLHSDNPAHIQSTHSVIAKTLPAIYAEESLNGKRRYATQRTGLIKSVRNISRELDLLAPAVDLSAGQRRPENCEYPWDGGSGFPVTPADYEFSNLSILQDASGKHLLKIVALAIDKYAERE
jgi:hypothetical protein